MFCVEVLRPSQPNGVMSCTVSLPNHTFTGQAWSSKRLTSIVHILSPETDNCPSWISGKERMTIENISRSVSMKECCWPRQGLNLRYPGLQSDGASKWATEAGVKKCTFWHVHPMETQINLHVPAVWSESLLSIWKHFASLAIQNASKLPTLVKVLEILNTKTPLFQNRK